MKLKFLLWFSCVGMTFLLGSCGWFGGGARIIPNFNNNNTQIAMPLGQPVPRGTITYGLNGAAYRAVSFSELPNWSQQPFAESLNAFRRSCLKLDARWSGVCQQASLIAPNDVQGARRFFESWFTPWQVSQNGQLGGVFTGYYEPVLNGDVRLSERSRFPIYGIPNDFVSVPLPANLKGSKAMVRINPNGANSGVITPNGQYVANLAQFPMNERSNALKGRFEGQYFVPYFTRGQINNGVLQGRAPILGYADDAVELFFLHIQGSGRIRTPDGRFIRLSYADKNEYPYVSIGKYMAKQGYLPLSQTSMQAIKAWLGHNPNHLAEVLGQNPSYVFFRSLNGLSEEGPIGALGVPLTAGLSAAVDKQYITLGAPLYVATTHPDTHGALNRLIMAQDTGGAIKGAVRVDYFWGYGDAAGKSAGKMKNQGYVWMLLPNGMVH